MMTQSSGRVIEKAPQEAAFEKIFIFGVYVRQHGLGDAAIARVMSLAKESSPSYKSNLVGCLALLSATSTFPNCYPLRRTEESKRTQRTYENPSPFPFHLNTRSLCKAE